MHNSIWFHMRSRILDGASEDMKNNGDQRNTNFDGNLETMVICWKSYEKPMRTLKKRETLQNTCFAISQIEKQQKYTSDQAPTNDVTKTQNPGTLFKQNYSTKTQVDVFQPMRNSWENELRQ